MSESQMNTNYDENDLIFSPLSQVFEEDNHSIEICIYRMTNTDWVLELVGEDETSTVWDEKFSSDEDALESALNEIRQAGGVQKFSELSTIEANKRTFPDLPTYLN